MMNRIRKLFGFTVLLCVLLSIAIAVPAFAATYSKIYGTTTDRIRVRESASSNASTIDNLVKDRCVYILQSRESGGVTWVEVKYRSHEGGTETGWVAQNDGKTTYVKILSATQAKNLYNVSDGKIPNKVAGVWTAKERAAAKASGGSSSSGSSSASTDTVKHAQSVLKNLGIYSGEVTGNVGDKTTAAIKEFQKRYGLTADGVLGPETIAKINSVGGSSSSSNSSGSSSTDTVKRAQTILKNLGIYSGEVTGNVGDKTTAAIKEFQRRNGLTADGVLGPATVSKLEQVAGSSSSGSSSTSSDTIKDVQAKLKNMGIYSGEVTGNVGDKTTAAIKEFQKRYGLTVDGVAGSATVAKLNQVYSNASTVKVSSGSTGLGLGSSGTAVASLQQDLTTLGFYWADITGNFGSKTQEAVKRFQKSYGLPQDGVAGSTTLSAIKTAVSKKGGSSASSSSSSSSINTSGILQLNSTGTNVSAVQTKLKALGFYSGEITGHYGEKTRDAVIAFQRKNNLTADGIAGPATLRAINNARASSSSSSSSSSSTGSSSISSTTLTTGSTGSAVRSLQINLTTLGYYTGDVTGHYGSMTAEAVRKYQKAKGLSQTGTASQSLQTRIANDTGSNTSKSSSTTVKTSLKEGDSGTAVSALQSALYKLGFYSGTISGNYGSLTAAAVRKFQDKNDLTVDGIAGPATIALINSKAGSSINVNSGTSSTSTANGSSTLVSYARVTASSAILRTKASATSASQVTMRNGTQMKIDTKVTTNGQTWYHVSAYQDGYTYKGYVRSDLVTIVSYSDFKANSNNNADADDEVVGILQVNSSDVAIREGPGMDYDVVGRVQYGDIYTYVDVVSGWYKLTSGSYINGSYITTNVDTSKLSDNDGTAYRYDDTAPMVTTIQEYLKKLGYYTGEITGHYGTKTVEAVEKFQSDNGLTADGIAGSKTIAKLQEKISGGSSGGSVVVTGVVYNVNWFTVKNTSGAFSKLGFVANQYGTLTDLTTGVSLSVKIQSTGNHIDAEPVTSSDTARFCTIYGVSNASSITSSKHYGRRPMLLQMNTGYKAVCSMYGVPHGKSTISDNNFPGQFCLHFLNSKTSGTDKVDSGHQSAISKAITIVEASGATVQTLNGVPN